MSNKKSIAKQYLKKHIDFEAIKQERNNSWLCNKPIEWLFGNGITFKHCYEVQKEAIKVADYKRPSSDRTLTTINTITNELIREYF